MSSRNTSPHDNPTDISSDLRSGTRIQVQGKIGTIRYVGTTSFQTGKWIGIELDEPAGKNSGVVQGKRYFDCRTNHGVFVRPSQVKVLPPSSTPLSRTGSEDDDDLKVIHWQQQQQQQDNDDNDDDDYNHDNSGEPMSRSNSSNSESVDNHHQQQQVPEPPPQSLTVTRNTTARVYGALDTSMPMSKSEQMIPLKDYEELRLKLKILESKRQEDRERYREHEKIKEEAEQFLTLRNKLQDKVAELQKELRETKKESKENDADRESFEFKYNDVLESLEMMTLDKEVAEERAENLQQEVNVLKDKLEEINVDLDILRKDADILNRAPQNNGDEKTPLEVIQLERHNERLKDALLRTWNVKTMNWGKSNANLSLVQYARTKEKLELSDSQNEHLKQRLDDALGAEHLVEQLAEKNLNLTEKLEELHSAVDDLEALKELADELEENHLETEKQLQAEIDHRDMLLREQLERIRSMEETSADYESTIQQFRELVVHLQSDLERLRHKEESQQSERQDLSSQSQAMMSLNMQLQSTVMKAQAKAIDLELRKLDAMQATDRLAYIQPYLPDAFFKTENDAISCFLLFKRLVFKSELIIKHLDQNHPISEKIMDTVTEGLVSVCELRQRAGWLGDVAKRFVTFIKHCKPETFTKMGQVYHDLMGTERRLNGIVELLRTDELNETECIVELQRMIAQLEHLTEVYLVPNESSNHVDQFFGLTRALDFNADRMTVEFTFVRQAVENAAKNDGIKIAEGIERLEYDYLEPLSRLIVQSKNSKIMARKLLRQLEDLTEQALAPKVEHLHRFKTLYAISSKISRFCFETYKQIAAYVDTKRGSKEEISLKIIQQIVYNKADEILEIAESTMWEGSLNTLKSLTNELSNTFSRVDNDNKMDKIVTGTAPWTQRASDMKAEVVVDHDKDRKLQQHADEILKLIKDIKMKDLSLQEAAVKVELLEKRMETAKKQAEQIVILEENLQKSQSQEQMYSEAMENLQAEYDSLERENGQLKKAMSVKEEASQSTVSHAASKTPDFEKSEVHESMEAVPSGNIATMNQQMESLKSAIRYLRAENTHLKSCDLARSLQIDHFQSKEHKEKDDNVRSQIRSYASESQALLKEIRMASASPTLVSLSPDHRNGKWQRRKHTVGYQYQTQQSVLHTLKQRSESLRAKMNKLQQDDPRQQWTVDNSKNSTGLMKSLVKIQLPRWTASTQSRHCIQFQSFT
ncbi:dynein associated protein-domain-containing protein [Chlamydoabsidia padenii]|nr:dynein associated protein-domain-containing protein [Chlamydoabsidia padenii]